MKKLVASVGLLALGASSLQTASAQGLLQGPDGSKAWSVSATLRGFYDDNVASIPDDVVLPPGTDKDTFGFEVSPSLSYRIDRGQTAIDLGYLYSYKYYDTKPPGSADHDDQSHTFNAALNHAFSERYQLQIADSFVIGQEPDLLRAGTTFNTFQRIPGDNIRNYGSIALNADLSPDFAVEAGYSNGYFNYDDEGPGSRSAVLDRIEHGIRLDGKWKATAQTTGILGYTFGMTDYTADELLSPASLYTSDVRNSRSHYVYAGADHNFTSDLSGSVRAGGRYIDFYNDPSNEDGVSPYVRASLRYLYNPQSFVEGGLAYDRSPTDVASIGSANFGDVTLDADTFTVFGTLNHQITSKLTGRATAQFQTSDFNGGFYDGESEQFYIAGLELEYRFTQNLAAHAGYNFDYLDSEIGRTFDRNRVYVGVTASY